MTSIPFSLKPFKDIITFPKRIKDDLQYLLDIKKNDLHHTMNEIYEIYQQSINKKDVVLWLQTKLYDDSCAQYFLGYLQINNSIMQYCSISYNT